MDHLTSLIIQAQAGSSDAYGQLARHFQDMAVGYAYALLGDLQLAEDAAQEALIEAFTCLAELRTPYAFPSWLRRIVFKHCDRYTRRQQPDLVEPALAENLSDPLTDQATMFEKNQLRDQVHRAIRALPPHQRQVITLHYFSGMDHKAIAAFLDIAPHTVNNRLRAGRRRLKQRMLAMFEDEIRPHRPSANTQFAATVEIFTAIHAGQTDRVGALLDQAPEQIHARHDHGRTPLHLAAYYGYIPLMELLLARGADPTATDAQGQTPLHSMGYIAPCVAGAERLLAAGADLNATDARGQTPIQVAALQLDERRQGGGGPPWWYIQCLHSKKAVLDVFTAAIRDLPAALNTLLNADPGLARQTLESSALPAGSTPLHHAADRGNTDSVKALLDCGADPNATDAWGRTPVRVAAHTLANCIEREFESCADTLDMLLTHGAALDVLNAAALGRDDSLRALLTTHPDQVRTRTSTGDTPLHLAAANGHGAAAILLEHGADVNARNSKGQTPLDLAAQNRFLSVTDTRGYTFINRIERRPVERLLLEQGATATIFTAARLGLVDKVAEVLQQDPDQAHSISAPGRSLLRNITLQWLWYGGDELQEIAHLVQNSGAQPDLWSVLCFGQPDQLGGLLAENPLAVNEYEDDIAPIHAAALLGHTQALEILLDHGASIHSRGCWSATPLHLAIWAGGHLDAVEFLLDRGADLEAVAAQHTTPLYTAVSGGHLKVVEFLLDRGARVNARSAWNGTPAHMALFTGRHPERQHEIFCLLSARGADLHLPDYTNTPAAFYAVQYPALLSRLVGLNLDLNATDPSGNTMLHHAAAQGQQAAVEWLLASGCAAGPVNNAGKTPHTLAQEKGHASIAALLSA